MSSLTNERLRYWLNANQAGRERMCAGLLGIAGDYTKITPRRPDGGPDGGRDLDAVYKRSTATAVGIGFRNNVRDDQDDKRWVLDKIQSDAANARRSGAKRFVFLTNVDLTPKELEGAFLRILGQAFQSCDIFHRERLRLLLDSPEGLGFRTAYLQIPMEAAEQAAFFEKFMSGGSVSATNAINERLDRMEFREEMAQPVKDFFIQFEVSDTKWWQRWAGGAFKLQVGAGFDSHLPFDRMTMLGVSRRAKRSKVADSFKQLDGLGRWIHLNAKVQRHVMGCLTDHSTTVPITTFDRDRISLHFVSASLFGVAGEAAANRWLDRTRWHISLPRKLAEVVTEMRLVIDSWWISATYAGEPDALDLSEKSVLGKMDAHRRELGTDLIKYGNFEIDFRRVSPTRIWKYNI